MKKAIPALILILSVPSSHAAPRPQAAGLLFDQAVTDGLVVMEAENFRTNTPQGGHCRAWRSRLGTACHE